MWPFRAKPASNEFRASIENPSVPLTDASAFYGVFGGGDSAAGVNVNADTALGIPAVWCAVNFLANTVASLPLNLFKRTENGNEKADKDPLYTILHDEVNDDYLTSFKWRKYSMVNTLLRGRSFTFIELNKAGRVMNLWPLDPTKVTVRRENGRMKYDYTDTASKKVTYDAFEIIDIPFMMNVDGVGSVDPVAKMKNSLGLSIALNAYASKFFQNGGVPPLAMEGPAGTTGAIKRAIADVINAIREASQEKRNILYMPPQHKLTPVGFNPQNSQMVEARKQQIVEVAQIYNLPPVFLQDLSTSTYSNSEQQDLHLTKHTLIHWLELWEQELNAKLFTKRNKTNFVEFSQDALLRGDFSTRMAGLASGIQNSILTPDEARDLENRPRKGGVADELWIQGGTIPIERTPPQAELPLDVPPAKPAADKPAVPADKQKK